MNDAVFAATTKHKTRCDDETNTDSGGDDGGDTVVEKATGSKRGRRDDAFDLDLIFSRESMQLSPLATTTHHHHRDTHRGGTTSTSRNNNARQRQQKKFPFEPSPKRNTKADDKNNSTLTKTTLMMQKKPPVQRREEKKTPKNKKRKAREEEEEEEEEDKEEDAKDDDDTIENTDRRTLRTTTTAETTREKKIFGAARARTESEHPWCRRKDGKEASASIGVTTTTTTTRKTTTGEVKKEEEEEKKKEEDGSTRTTTRAKRRRRCSDATTQEEEDGNAVDGEKATPATVFGRVFDDKDTLENASSKPSSSSSMVFDASKKTTTDDVARMKRKPATKSYKNFTKKKPPSRGESFPAFNVAAAVAKKKAQIEAAKVQEIGFGSSARKPAGIDPIPTTNTTTTTTNTGGSIAKKKMKSLSSPLFQGEHQQDPREEQEVVSEFQKMIQKARENLESSKAAADLCSPGVAAGVNVNASSPSRRENMHNIQRQKITTTTMLPSSTSKSFHQQQHRSANKMSSSFVAAAQGASAQKRGKHQRFASPPLRTTTTKGAAEEYHPQQQQQQQQQQRRKEPVQQPPTRGLSSSTPAFPVNQAFVFAATNSNSQIIDIVAKATRKTYDPSTAEKAKRKAKDAYGKKRIEAHKKEKLGQLKDLDDVLSSKSSSFEASTKIVEDTTQTETKGGKPHFLGTTTSSKDAKARRTNRVFGGAMTKAQKAHMAMEWEPL